MGKGLIQPRDHEAAAADGLDQRLREYLDRPSDDPSRTWSDRILEALVAEAVRGDLRAQHEVFQRVGAASKTNQVDETCSIDDETARKVLEAVRGPVKDRTRS